MMSARSTPNLQQQARDNKSHNPSIYSYLQNQSGLSFAPVSTAPSRDSESSPPPTPPVRDSSSLKSVKYGPGHEKFPSWPVPAAAEAPQVLRGPPSGGSHRSKSWTDHTNYPKEKVMTYARPYMKRQHSAYAQQKLKTVMERCEKFTPESFESRLDKMNDRLYLPRVDREGKALGDLDYMVPSPPERDVTKPQLTQADLEEYARSYQDPSIAQEMDKYGKQYQEISSLKGSLPHLTQADLEEYTRSYEEALHHQHQKQPSYAQSEGYHSYVSSTDSTSTPFLDRLRRDSEVVAARPQSSTTWDDSSEQERECNRREGRDSVVTTSSGSVSSSETLKWHGSMSDVSVASSSCTHLANSSSMSRQLIAHSARVQTPQRHHSESVLYMGSENGNQEGWKDRETRNNNHNKLKLFPVNTYTVQPTEQQHSRLGSMSSQPSLSVADRVSELEKQTKYTYLDPEKKHRVSDPTLKAIQKKALLSFYERHHTSSGKSTPWRSEPQLAQSLTIAPQPPPRPRVQTPSRRASSASDYASGSRRSSVASNREAKTTDNVKTAPRHQHSNSCGSLSADLLGPVIMGPAISVDDWVPERPPKNPHLRTAYPDLFQDQRIPSPDLPPPSPPTVTEDEVFNNDEPLPPPPPELDVTDWQQEFNDRLKENTFVDLQHKHHPQDAVVMSTKNNQHYHKHESSIDSVDKNIHKYSPRSRSNSSNPSQLRTVKMHPETKQTMSSDKIKIQQQQFMRSTSLTTTTNKNNQNDGHGFPNQRSYAERSSTRYPAMQKLVLNGSIAVSQKVVNGISDQHRAEPLRAQMLKPLPVPNVEEKRKPPAQLPPPHVHRGSIIDDSAKDMPPPLQPRQMRINQSMRARIPDGQRPGNNTRTSPPKDDKLRDPRPLTYTMSQSKASYLASRRDRERGVPNADTGSYKRTMSPGGNTIAPENTNGTDKVQRSGPHETLWPSNRSVNDNIRNNNNLLRRSSLSTPKNKKDDTTMVRQCDEEKKKVQCVLPDVLPVSAKVMAPRSQQFLSRPSQLSLNIDATDRLMKSSPPHSPMVSNSNESAPNSPTKSPLRTSPPSSLPPLRSSPLSSLSSNSSVRTSPAAMSPLRSSPASNSPIRTSPLSLTSIRTSPLSIAPIRISPLTSSSPPKTPLTSPPHSPPITTTTPETMSISRTIECTETPKVIEGLQMIQRTEVILRVNACTIDAASQTEKEEMLLTPLPTRRKLQEEIECEKLSQDLVNQLSPSDRLKCILVPGPDHKKPTDYVTGLFRIDVTSRPRPANSPFRSRNNTPSSSPPPITNQITTLTTSSTDTNNDASTVTVHNLEPSSPLSATSTYFTTSESKAKFLTRYSRDMHQFSIVKDTKDLNQKKEELVSRLDRKLEVLRSEQLVVSEECRVNNELGENVELHVGMVARSHEAAKYRLHVEEVGKITSLLLGLSGRLARAENALMGLSDDHPEKKILEAKRDKLQEQLEEAKKLKESIDRRSISVSNILYQYLNSEEYADYDHFINMKAKLIMDSREIADKIKLGEEQLVALKETLVVTD